MKKFVLAGNPNCGKTTLFNSLTGSNAHVGNWPGVTVDKKEGICKFGKEDVKILDLPGIYSLSPYTPEEVIARSFIIDEKPDCIINIIDVTNLERNLYLTTQLMEIDIPIIVALNMVDVLESNNESINIKQLEMELGIPIVPISALKKRNLKNLIETAIKYSKIKREGHTVLANSPLSHLITDLTIAFHSLNFDNPLYHAIKLAEMDEIEISNHSSLVHMVEHFKQENMDSSLNGDFEAVIADERYKYITSHFSPCLTKKDKDINANKKQDKIDKILTNKFFGIPIFILILFIIFHVVFSTNFLFIGSLTNFSSDCFSNLEGTIWSGFKGLFYTTNGVNSPGIIISNLINGLTHAFSESIKIWMNGAPAWVTSFICEGILGGLFLILGFLPQILLLFLLFSILEDSGYMARIAFILDKLFKKIGLSGRSVLPMIMGFGCSVPAILNTRTIYNEYERTSNIRVIPFFSCGAKLPILTCISGCLALSFGFANPDLVTLLMYLLGIIVAIISLIIFNLFKRDNYDSSFVMELPAYHMPQFKSTILLVWDKMKAFLKKAFTIIIASTIVIWAISHLGWNWQYLEGSEIQNSILASFGKLLSPVFIPLGFGLSAFAWIFIVSIISGIIAKENVVAVFATLSLAILASLGYKTTSDNSINEFIKLLTTTGSQIYDPFFASHGVVILLSFIAFNMLTIPCIGTISASKAELPKGKFKTTLLFWLIVSFVVSSAIFVIGSWWWSSFIYVFVIATILIVSLIISKKINKTKSGNIL